MSEPRPLRTRSDVSPRFLAASILAEIGRTRGFSNRILDRELARASLPDRDRGLTTTLVYGVLRLQARLDAVIDTFANKPRGLKGPVRIALRIAAFECLELAHPIHAVASQMGDVLQRFGKGSMRRPCHAVVRAIDRDGASVVQKLGLGKPLDVLERYHSLPRWLAGRWRSSLGFERAQQRANAINSPCPVDLRIDVSRTDVATVAAALQADPFAADVETFADHPHALRIRRGGALTRHPMHQQGLFSVQSLSSQQAVLALAPEPGMRVLDACAGIGVKTLQLAEVMQRRGTLVATEPSPRIKQLRQTALRGQLVDTDLELEIIAAAMDGPDVPGVDDALPFDAVLVDAPCTGLGNLGRHPELRWTSRYEDIASCVVLQQNLIRRCWRRVAPGGRLCYAVCSSEPEEGEQLVAQFLADTRDAALLRQASWTPESHHSDGFYLACLGRAR